MKVLVLNFYGDALVQSTKLLHCLPGLLRSSSPFEESSGLTSNRVSNCARRVGKDAQRQFGISKQPQGQEVDGWRFIRSSVR